MFAKKKVCVINIPEHKEFWDKIEKAVQCETKWDAVQKDILLIEAAIETDKIVISRDEKVREYFREAASDVSELKIIVWVNPDKDEETPIQWLENGAEAEKARMLGA